MLTVGSQDRKRFRLHGAGIKAMREWMNNQGSWSIEKLGRAIT